MESMGLDLSLGWIPQERNAEADDLSNLKTAGFADDLRVHVDLSQMPFLVLGRLAEDAKDFYGHAQVLRAKAVSVRHRRARPADRLRTRDPW